MGNFLAFLTFPTLCARGHRGLSNKSQSDGGRRGWGGAEGLRDASSMIDH